MAGKLITILPKRTFDFSGLISGSSMTQVIVEQIDISEYIDGLLIVRVHAVNSVGGNMSFQLVQDGFSERDPSIIFLAPPSAYFCSAAVVDSTVVPGKVIAGGGNMGGFLGEYAALTVTASRVTTGSITASVSADLLMRSPDDSDGNVAQNVATSMAGCQCA